MRTVLDSVLRPIGTAIMAVFLGSTDACIPPGGADLEAKYNAELAACVADAGSLQESCLCRKEVDERWGLCDRPEWPRIGRCDHRCE